MEFKGVFLCGFKNFNKRHRKDSIYKVTNCIQSLRYGCVYLLFTPDGRHELNFFTSVRF